jgi:hypothetical protein
MQMKGVWRRVVLQASDLGITGTRELAAMIHSRQEEAFYFRFGQYLC